MSRLRGAALFLLLALLFLAANRPAYKGWFNDDDLDNLLWTTRATTGEFAAGLVSPVFGEFNYRPAAHIVYHVLGRTVGLEYGWYLGLMHAVHLLNCWLVWLVLRKLGAGVRGAGAGTLLFAFHMACFDAYWKPMFVFDVFVTTFILLAFLAWLHDRFWLALLPFWLALKSKELAVAFPALLLAYEYLLGRRRWKQIVPFAVISAAVVLQGVLKNASSDNDYTLRYTPQAVWTTLRFYSSQILLVPWLGLALIPLGFLTRDRRVRFGLLAIGILLGPLWFLPGRSFGVYLYLPLIGLAVALAFASERWKPAVLALLFAAWIPWNYTQLREGRKSALTIGPENRGYVAQVEQFKRTHPGTQTVLFDGGPAGMGRWGMEASIRWFYRDPQFKLAAIEDAVAPEYAKDLKVAVLGWERAKRQLLVTEPQPDMAYIDMARTMPFWQFGPGWHSLEGGFRWTQPSASLRLHRPATARHFELKVKAAAPQVDVLLDGQSLGVFKFEQPGEQTHRWPVPPGPERAVRIELVFDPPYRPASGDPRSLGAAVAALGFVE